MKQTTKDNAQIKIIIKERKQMKNYLCKEGKQDFIIKAKNIDEAEEYALMYNATVIGLMEVETKKNIKLTPIGDIAFVFSSKSRRKGKRILISDVNTIWASQMDIDEKTEKQLQKAMKEKGSDLLTDGYDFYTTVGGSIAQIEHPQFKKELEHFNNLYN